MRFDQMDGHCFVFVFKEGLLSKIGHDLKLKVGSFQVRVDTDAGRVEAEFDAGSLEVVCAMAEGREAPDQLSDKDRRTIAGNIRTDVLHSARYPHITFQADQLAPQGEGYLVVGRLTIKEEGREVTIPIERRGDELVGRVRLHQPDFGIKPYRALLGTLKVQADVVVEVRGPAPSADAPAQDTEK